MEKTVRKVASVSKEKQSHGRSVLPRERTKFLHFPVTPTGVAPIAEKSIHWLLLNSIYNGVIRFALELVLHSAIVTDFAIGKDCPESRICFKGETVTRTERASEGKNEISSLPGHTNGSGPHRREEHSLALVELHLQWSYPLCLRAGSSLRNCDRLCHWKRLSGKSHLFQSGNSHTDGACFRGKERNFFTSRSHQREWPPSQRRAFTGSC